MARYTKQTVTSLQGINSELTKIQTAFQDTLSRKGNIPNQMEANLDMNSYRVLNLVKPISDHEPLRLKDLKDFLEGLDVTEPCAILQPNFGSITDESEYQIDFGDIVTTPTCFQDLGTLPDVIGYYTDSFSLLASELISNAFTVPFNITASNLDLYVNGGFVTDYLVTSNTITIASAFAATLQPDDVIQIRHRRVTLN